MAVTSGSGNGPAPARPAGLRAEQRALTRSRLIGSAIEVFGRRGFQDATIGDITTGAGASRATFYLHFRDKEEIASAVFAQTRPDVEDYYSRLDTVLELRSRRDLREWMGEAFHWFEEHESIVIALEHIRITHGEFSGEEHDFVDHMPKYLEAWPVDQREEAALRVRLLVLLISRAFIEWRLTGGTERDVTMMVDVLTDIGATMLRVDTSD